MRTRTFNKNKINVVTLGCSKNLYDSEVLISQLKANNKNVVHEGDGNIVVINTCGFIDNAKQQSIDTILEYSDKKNQGKIDKLYVTGCLSERYKDDLEKEIPDVDKYFGTTDLPHLLKHLRADYKSELIGERFLSTPKNYAYLKISEGCDRKCSFCAIPLMRGKHKSRSIEDIVREAKKMASQGVKELILIAQELTYYGLDLYKERSISKLLKKICDLEGIEWVRLHYAYPSGFPNELIDTIKNQEKICNYLDIPLQHISDEILKSMRRGSTKLKTNNLITNLRKQIPEISIRTTLIVGYPGETKTHFKELCDWVKEMKFERLGCFKYSHEENTHAYNLVDDVTEIEKQRRLEKIMSIQKEISRELNQKKIGNEIRCLIDRFESGYYIGRSEYDSPDVDNNILIKLDNIHLRIGEFYNVIIDDASDYDLFGSIK
ncbi:MAG: 30S ribosomal protein S12 methylthiotransferase RimO [Flavobacteriaceae bacterium]|nr:30S ribosomal protein S12 methylthiotransferase RimO [Flavobacteriaceae bacterium]MBL6681198.1 30S ribosomal protein S12 methylthiotransferase RimO [Flavobacteriaceae bacterium]